MRHLPHSIYYTNAEELIDELENLTHDEIKNTIRDIVTDNAQLLRLSERATIALDQYKELISLVDGIIIHDEMDDEESLKLNAKNSVAEIFLRLIFSMKNTSYWLMILSDYMQKYATKDTGLHKLVLVLKEMSKGILSASRKIKYKHPTKRKKAYVRNLERPKEKNGGRKVQKKVPTSSPVKLPENKEVPDRENAAQSEGERADPPESTPVVNNETPVEAEEQEEAKSEEDQAGAAPEEEEAATSEVDAGKSDEELEETAVELSAEASESDTNEGEANAIDRSPEERQKKNEKTFGISYFKTENLFRNGVVESSKTYQSISRRQNKTSPSSAFHRKRNSFKYNVNRNSQPSNMSRNGLGESEHSHLHSDIETVSKGPRRYWRKRTQSSSEKDTGENPPKRQRRSNSSSNRGYVSEGESRGRRRSRKDSFDNESQTATKSSISFEQPKRKRGRRRKVDIILQKIMDDRDRKEYGLKYACVHLSDVLEDPSVQHYADIIQMSHRKKKINTKLKGKQKRSRDKGEADENSLGKETNEIEVEWNVLDESVSDEEERGENNDEESAGVDSDHDEQASESEADQEMAEDNDQEPPDEEEEVETESVETKQTDERCHSPAGQDESSHHSNPTSETTKQCTESSSNHPSAASSSHEESDSERKPPKSSSPTPDSHRASSPEVFHTEDENDAEAEEESVRSDDEEGEKVPSSASESPSKYGSEHSGNSDNEEIVTVSEDEENANSSD